MAASFNYYAVTGSASTIDTIYPFGAVSVKSVGGTTQFEIPEGPFSDDAGQGTGLVLDGDSVTVKLYDADSRAQRLVVTPGAGATAYVYIW